MSLDWLDELNQIREDAVAKEEEETKQLDVSNLKREAKSKNVLVIVDAHTALRRMNQVLLGGKGVVDLFDSSRDYDRAIGLVWQGSIAKPRRPSPEDDSPTFYILVGAKDERVFVNGKRLRYTTPESLKEALVKAAKNPIRRKH
ncbi:MAG: hypothetical protein R3264_10430 [Anaerolineae bacterium]|nr:hypothetical protein [Anaerolineae bacterium]